MPQHDSTELDLNPFYRPSARAEVLEAFFSHGRIFLRDQFYLGNSLDEITGVMYESINVILNHPNVRARAFRHCWFTTSEIYATK